MSPENEKLTNFLAATKVSDDNKKIIPRWWSGGISGACSQCIVAPFDLLETQMIFLRKDMTMVDYVKIAIKNHGFLSLYDGLSAQFLRQLSYTTLRFHLYQVGKRYVDEYNFIHKVCVASISGFVAGIVGIPCELVNTRMHVDRLLKVKYRRNYKNAFDGLHKIWRDEGFRALYTGGLCSFTRATIINIGQNAMYDQSKMMYTHYYAWNEDSKILHITSSLTAAVWCVPLVQPIEILKTMQMNRTTGYLTTTSEKITYMMRFGIRGLFRGIMPNLLRMIPQTIIMFLLYEQLRFQFGYYE
ncbi:mitochondrial dicarboxylate carrier isoform X1 [Drosophila navojoa]|uniref:mitochondrial dicarboxylate carrier isoform X1 n=1 Tax=Drosophila navojoa TaxID=7232 RepID=UPI0011BF81F1|nr:mitochondrial dicarboxylate carrier isoform X1 [Drosophila navojoa]